MKLKLQTLAGNQQFHYLTGKHKMFVTAAAKFLTRAKIKYKNTKFRHGISIVEFAINVVGQLS